MMFNSFRFIVFFVLVLSVYFVISPKYRRIFLLASSCLFYGLWDPSYMIIMLFCIGITFSCGILIENYGSDNRLKDRKALFAVGITANLAILFFYKYRNMFIDILNPALASAGMKPVPELDIVLPVGISFYIFQALGYMTDVYRGDVKASRNLTEYALFVMFFPQLVAGPIERSGNMIKQIRNIDKIYLWDVQRIKSGLYTMLWGYFMKTVIADRAALVTDTVFRNYELYGRTELILGILCFSLQIYCDFGGYSAIAIGAARVMGIELMENFKVPYFSGSIKEFWNRWHISLSTWFRDYIYIPLGGNRRGRIRKYVNLMTVFLVSGLWHGADWSFVVWGGLHGIYQICEDCLLPCKQRILEKYKINTACFSWKLLEALAVFLLTSFAWIFFRADNIHAALVYIYRIFAYPDTWILFDGGINTLGIAPLEFHLLLISVTILIVMDSLYVTTGKKLGELLQTQNMWFRWTVTVLLICSCVFLNCSGNAISQNQFIYFQF